MSHDDRDTTLPDACEPGEMSAPDQATPGLLPIEPDTAKASSPLLRYWHTCRAPLLLVAILATALAFRLYHVNWDEKQHAHPDERWISMVASDLEWPRDLSAAFNPRRSPLNPLWSFRDNRPRSFAYGHLPLYLITGSAWLLEYAATLAPKLSWFPGLARALGGLTYMADYDQINLWGRVLSALADVGVVWLIYALGKRLYGRGVGLLAAAFVALTVSHIQLSHYAAFDTFATFFIVLTLYGSICLWQRGKWGDLFLTGAAAGMAISSKFSAMPILLAPALACLARALAEPSKEVKIDAGSKDVGHRSFWSDPARFGRAVQLGAAVLAVAVVFFVLTSPFAVLDFERFLVQIGEQGAMVRGISDLPYTRQYRHTPAYIYHIEQQLHWGMGWPLGLLAFASLGYFVLRNLRDVWRCPRWGDLIILAWVLPYFLIVGSFMVKFMRYMLPLLPFLCLMGAELLQRLWEAARSAEARRTARWRAWRQGAVALLAVVVLVGTTAYALAFVGIYGRTHTWIAASRWIYENIPDGAVLAVEHWDDNLPKGLPEPGMNAGARGYRHVELPMYEPDNRFKLETIRRVLRQADYIILSSNRLYRTIPRLPERYPVSTEYYRLLFSEQLGFKRLKDFTSYPYLGPWEIVDDDADESFTVYDHPKPIIFIKMRDLTDEEWQTLFAEALEITPQVEARPSGPRRQEEVEKTLLLEEPVESLPVVRGLGWNKLASQNAAVAALFWWLILEVIGVLALPLAFVVFRHLKDRGYSLAKALGWLFVGFVNWWLASLRILRNTLPTILWVMLLLGGLSYLIWRRRRQEMVCFWRDRWRLLAFNEGLFALAFLAFVIIRLLNPDLWQPWFGGEKFMELAFLNAILRSPYFPPYDPYFAGGYLNYYYYGQYLVSILIKLSGVISSVGFNLAIPTLFALTIGNAFSVGYNLVPGERGRKFAGVAGAVLVAVIGNLTAMNQIIGGWLQAGSARVKPSPIPALATLKRLAVGFWGTLTGELEMPAFDYWHRSTRVIPNTINEFPYFSFLFADLHPHMIGIPFTILVLALLLNAVLGGRPSEEGVRDTFGEHVLRFLALPLALGALGAINTWDLPTYLGITFLAIAIQRFLRRRVLARSARVLAASILIPAFFVALLSVAFYWPFYHYYQALSVGIGFVRQRSELKYVLTIWGLFLFLAASYLALGLMRNRARLGVLRYLRALVRHAAYLPHVLDLHAVLVSQPKVPYIWSTYGLSVISLVALVLAVLKEWTLFVLFPLVAVAALLLLRDDAEPEERFTHLLTFTGLLVMLGVEIVYMKDFLGGGDWRRMNTLFKFYIQVWVLLGLAMGAALPRLWSWVCQWKRRGWRLAWCGVCVFLIASGLLYPILATPTRIQQRFPPRPDGAPASPPVGTLDGMAYMTAGIYTWPDERHPIELEYDYEAIRWLLENVKGTPVIAEARVDYYREGGLRVTSFTGFPGLVGAHQGEQRYDWQVGPRDGLARELFDTSDTRRAEQIIRELGVRYIYVGQLERYVHNTTGLRKFERMAEDGILAIAFENEQVRIYRVVD